jgi:1,4-dihydroxy-2-naphthoate polyprenyltransferase
MIRLLGVARPRFLLTGLVLFVFGAAWAMLLGAAFSASRMLLGYLILLPAHLSVSFSNDYFDIAVDSFGSPSPFTGGSGVLVHHPELREPARRTALGLMVCSMLLGILFMNLYSYPPWFLGYVLLGNLVGWYYSAPPLRLAYRGLGELTTALTAGVLVPGMGYLVMGGNAQEKALLFVIPLLLLGLAFILTVEIPDMEMDRLGNKRTWVARRGRAFGFIAAGISLLAATGYFVCLPWLSSQAYPLDLRILGFLSLLPLSAGVIGMLRRPAQRQPATRIVNAMIVTLALFFILADAYLLYLVAR